MKKSLNIIKTVQKFPGGMMVIPLSATIGRLFLSLSIQFPPI